MHQDSFQRLFPIVYTHVSNQIRHNDITEECTIIDSPFGYIGQIADSVDWPNNRNQTLFHVNILFDSSWNLIQNEKLRM
jgi:hypothetical protein